MDDAQCTASRLAIASFGAWREKDGVIYFKVTSNGRTGEKWITYLESRGIKLDKWAKDVLRSPDFKPTNGITTDIAVLKSPRFTDKARITSLIRSEADKLKFSKPNAEVACLIRVMFTDEEIKAMGLMWIVTMHEPIEDSARDPNLLGVSRCGVGRWLRGCYGGPGRKWRRWNGFAFVVPQASPYR